MKMIRRIIAALSLYTRLPMPFVRLDDGDMGHVISFLPLAGVIIGAVSYLVIMAGVYLSLPCMVLTILLSLVPIVITGGFHADGFMDVSDAIHSYRSREQKIQIMKDPHVGGFAIISFTSCFMLWIAAIYLIIDKALAAEDFKLSGSYTAVFFLVRAFCGITSIILPGINYSEMLKIETEKSGRGDICFLSLQVIIAVIYMMFFSPIAAIVCFFAMLLFCLWYGRLTRLHFGGVNGDCAGYFVVMGEVLLAVILAVLSMLPSVK